MSRDRRLVRIGLTEELFKDLFTTGYFMTAIGTVEGLPKDSTWVGSSFDPSKMVAYMVYYHPSFEIVPEGEEIPTLRVLHVQHGNHSELVRKISQLENIAIGGYKLSTYMAAINWDGSPNEPEYLVELAERIEDFQDYVRRFVSIPGKGFKISDELIEKVRQKVGQLE